MKKAKKQKVFDVSFEKRTIPESLIDAATGAENWDKKTLKTRAAYLLLNGLPEFSVNEKEDGRYQLLANDRDFYAAKLSGAKQFEVRVYAFTERNAECFSLLEKLKTERLGAMEEGYLM